MRISVVKDGPYIVSGGVPLLRLEIVVNEAGESVGWREVERIETPYRYMLCRCGRSGTMPFCDGSHEHVGFDGAETAGHGSYMEQAVTIDGPGMLLRDVRELCAEARFCDRAGGLWNLVERCDEPGVRALVEEEAMLCPSGRYVACDADTEQAYEPEIEPSIALVEDPALGVSGPLWVRGGIEIVDAEDEPYETRNRVTLCRCGASARKPFCDGTHVKVRFDDGSVTEG